MKLPEGQRDKESTSEREYLEISADRRLKLFGDHTQRALLERSGRWSLLDTGNELVVFQRLPANKHSLRLPEGRVLMTGQLAAAGMFTATDVISFLQIARATCWIVFISENIQKTLVFSNGDLLAVQSNQVQDKLGEVLYRYGYLTREQLDRALRQVGVQRRLGRILQEQGLLSVDALWKNIRRQMEEVFYSVLELSGGAFHVLDAPVARFPTQTLISTQGLVLEGLKRLDERRLFRRIIANEDVVLELTNMPSSAKVDADVRQLITILKAQGPLPLEQLGRISMLGPHLGARAAYEGILQGLIRIAGP